MKSVSVKVLPRKMVISEKSVKVLPRKMVISEKSVNRVCIIHTFCNTCLQPIEGGIYTLLIHSCHNFLTIWENRDFCTRHISNDTLIDLNDNGGLTKWDVPTSSFWNFTSPRRG